MSTVQSNQLGKTIYADDIKLVKGTVKKTVSSSLEQAGLQLLRTDHTALYKRLEQMGADDIITPLEKKTISREWSGIQSGKGTTISQADKYGVTGQQNYTGWLSAYGKLESFLSTVLDPEKLDENTDISGLGDLGALFEAYYTAKARLDEQLFSAESGIIGSLDDRAKLAVEITGPTVVPMDGSPVTLTAMLLQDGIDVTGKYGADNFTWQRISSDTTADTTWRDAGSAAGKTLAISSADLVDGAATFLCKFKYFYSDTLYFFKTGTAAVTLEVPGEDAVSVQILSLNGDKFRAGTCDTTLVASVWKGEEDITGTLDESAFSWERTSGDAASDGQWNTSSKATRHKSVTLTPEDVAGRAVFACYVDIGD